MPTVGAAGDRDPDADALDELTAKESSTATQIFERSQDRPRPGEGARLGIPTFDISRRDRSNFEQRLAKRVKTRPGS